MCMEIPSRNILSYAQPPKSPFQFNRRTCIRLATYAAILFLLYAFLRGPTSGQIRLDTGDLRYCWCGIPLLYRQMPEPERTKILKLAAAPIAIPHQWITCVTYPLHGSNNPDLMCRSFYRRVAIWSDIDPHIARWTLEDVATYIHDTHATHSLPESCVVLESTAIDTITGKPDPDWRKMKDVKDYCLRHSYAP